MSTMELVADLKFLLTSNEAWEHLRNFGFLQQVTGKNGQHLDYIKQSSGATVTMKPRNMNLKEGLSFTIKHHRLDEIREAASLLHSLLEKIQIDFKEYLGNRRVPKNAVDFEMETNQARCGKCKKDFSTLFDLEDHIEEHNAPRPPPVTTATKKVEEAPSAPSTTTSTTTSNTYTAWPGNKVEEAPSAPSTTTSNTYTAWPGNNKSENGKTTQGANMQENSAEEFINFSNVFQKAKSPGESAVKRKLSADDVAEGEPPAKAPDNSDKVQEPQKEVDDPDLPKMFLQESLRKRENNEMDDIQTLMIINKIKKKLHFKEKEDISLRVANIVKYMNMRREAGSKVDSTELLTVNLKVSIKIVAQKLGYDMSVSAVNPGEESTPPTAADALAAAESQSTPPQSPSVALNAPKFRSAGIAIKLSYNHPQTDKPVESESGKQFSQVLSVPNPLEKPALAQSRSAQNMTEVKKMPVTTTAMLRKSTQPQVSKLELKCREFDSKFSTLKEKVAPFLEKCSAAKIEDDLTETIDKMKEKLSEEVRTTVKKTFNREINLWQAKNKKKIPPAMKQGLHFRVAWSKCEEKLTECAKEEKERFLPLLGLLLKTVGHESPAESPEEEEVKVDWSRKLSELKKKMDSFLDHCLSEDEISYDLSDKITRLNEMLSHDDQEVMTKAMNRQINVLQQKEKKKVNFSTRQALQLKVVWTTCYKKLSVCAKEMKSEYREVVKYTLDWIDNWYFDGKAPNRSEEKGIASLASEWTFQSAIGNISNSPSNGSEDSADRKNMTYIEKQLEELNEKLDPFLRECYGGRGPDLVPTIRKLENKLRPVQKEGIEQELNKEATESERKLKRHLKDCERDVLHLRTVWKAIYEYLKIGAKGNNPECRGMIVSLLLWVKNENKSIESDSKDPKKDGDNGNSWLDETSDSKDMSTIPTHLDKDLKEHLVQRESGKLTNGKTLAVIRNLKQNLSAQEKGEIGKLISTAHSEEAKLKGELDASEKISIHLRVTCDFIQNRRRRALVNFR